MCTVHISRCFYQDSCVQVEVGESSVFVLKGLFIVRRRLFTDSWLSVNNCRLFTDSELDRLGAGLALHVATPVELALATLFHSEGKYNREDKTMKSMRGHG